MSAVPDTANLFAQDGRQHGYKAAHTLPIWVEVVRQARRKRTQWSFGFLVLLPVILVAAFTFGSPGESSSSGSRGLSLVDIATASAANFTLFTLFASSTFLLVVIVALFCGDCISAEASWGSLRYLLAIPVPRSRLLRQKFLVSLGYSALAVIILPLSALAVGAAFFGWNELQTPLGEQISPNMALLRIAAIVSYIAVSLLMVASLALWLSVMTDAPLGAVGGAVMIYIVSNILDTVTALGGARDFLPTRYNLAWLNLLSSPLSTTEIIQGCISTLLYSTVFIGLAWWKFLRKDIVS